MSSSVVTAVPSGVLSNLLLGPQVDWHDEPYHPANATLGEKDGDFQSICCDGDIIDTTANIWAPQRNGPLKLNLKNLVCCRIQGPQQGGLSPIDPDQTHCTEGNPVPLASLAATNAKNAAIYLVTYTSASFGAGGEVGDFVVAAIPTCIWVNTKAKDIGLTSVTVPAANISTMPVPTTSLFGYPTRTQVPLVTPHSQTAGSESKASATSLRRTTEAPSIKTAEGSRTATTSTSSSSAARLTSTGPLAAMCLGLGVFSLLLTYQLGG